MCPNNRLDFLIWLKWYRQRGGDMERSEVKHFQSRPILFIANWLNKQAHTIIVSNKHEKWPLLRIMIRFVLYAPVFVALVRTQAHTYAYALAHRMARRRCVSVWCNGTYFIEVGRCELVLMWRSFKLLLVSSLLSSLADVFRICCVHCFFQCSLRMQP